MLWEYDKPESICLTTEKEIKQKNSRTKALNHRGKIEQNWELVLKLNPRESIRSNWFDQVEP